MSLSAPKNYTTRTTNTKNQKGKKKDIKLQAYDYCKKLYKKYYANPNIVLLNQLKETLLSLYLNHLSIKDISIMNEIFLNIFIFNKLKYPSNPKNQNQQTKDTKQTKK